MNNRNTTMLGIGAILTAAGGILTAIFDGDVDRIADLDVQIEAARASLAELEAA